MAVQGGLSKVLPRERLALMTAGRSHKSRLRADSLPCVAPGTAARFRRPGTVAAGALMTAGFAVGLVVAMLDDGVNGVNAGFDQKAVGATVICTVAWFIWRVTVYPCVEVTESRLTVRQPFTTYQAPWPAVGEPDALDGLRIPLAGHGVSRPWAFSSSLLADLTGDRVANEAVSRIDALRRGATRDPRAVERTRSLGLAGLGLACFAGLTVAAVASVL